MGLRPRHTMAVVAVFSEHCRARDRRGVERPAHDPGAEVDQPANGRWGGISAAPQSYSLSGFTKIIPRVLPKPVAIGVRLPLSRF